MQVLQVADRDVPHGTLQSCKLKFTRLALAHGRAVARKDAQAAHNLTDEMEGLAGPCEAVDIDLR